MEHAVQQVVPERVQGPVNVRPLAAGMAIFARSSGAAVQAVCLVRVPVALTRDRLDCPGEHPARRRVTDRFKIRHPTSP